MSITDSPPSKASAIMAKAGVAEDFAFYGPFTGEDEKAALTVPVRITAAWRRNDPDMFAEIFTENGSLLMQDNQLKSREEIRAYMAAGFAGPLKGAHVSGWPLHVSFLSPGVAMVITQGGIIFAGETERPPEREIRAMWILVEQDGEWKLFSHQSSPVYG